MPQFYYQIKGLKRGDEQNPSEWAWPPVFSGLVDAVDRKEARAKIEDEYGRQFPVRVLRKDIEQHSYLLHFREVDPTDTYTLRRFQDTACLECGTIFKVIDKYNDFHSDNNSSDYCSARCAQDGRHRKEVDYQLVSVGRIPPVIYSVRQKSTGMVYVGQTTQPFTLRWWNHISYPSECKFHAALKKYGLADWDFSVLEVIDYPEGVKGRAAFITDRERHWIDTFNSVAEGYNTVLPSAISPQQPLELEQKLDEPAF